MKNVEVITLKKENIEDFAKERNLLLSKAKKEWVFFLDLDETIPPELASEIENLNFKKNGYYVKRENYFLGQYIGDDRILRLIKRGSGTWKRMVHETWDVKGDMGDLKNPIIHNTADNLSDYIKKINFYSTLHAKANQLEGKKSSVLKIVIYPKLKFWVELTKSRNATFSIMQAFHSFLSWSKLYFLHS